MEIKLLNELDWKENYSLILTLHEEASESAYLSANYDLMNKYAEIIIKNVKKDEDSSNIYKIIIQSSMSQNKLKEAVLFSLEILKKLGVQFPKKFRKFFIFYYILKIQFLIKGEKINKIKTCKK